MARKSRTQENKDALLEALRRSLGNVTAACLMANLSRETHYRWLAEDEKYKAAVEDIEEQSFDFVEDKLMRKIKDGDTTAIIFYCKTRMKRRGYVERQEVELDGDTVIKVDFSE